MGAYNSIVDDSVALSSAGMPFLTILHDYMKENTIIVIVPPTIQFLYFVLLDAEKSASVCC